MTLDDDLKDEVRRLLCGDAQFLSHLTPVEWRDAAIEYVRQSYEDLEPEEAVRLVEQEAIEMARIVKIKYTWTLNF